MTITESQKRIGSIDIAKAIGIILIVIGHIQSNENFTHFIYSFHVPIFFIISGYLYKKTEKLSEYVKKKAKTILIPYFIFGAISLIYWFVIERYFREQIVNPWIPVANLFLAQAGEYNFIANAALWFLPCLFCTELIFDILKRITKNEKVFLLGIILISAIGLIYNKLDFVSLPFELNTAFVAVGFYYLGYVWKNKFEQNFKSKINKNWQKVTIAIVCLIITFIFSQINNGISMYGEYYNNYFLMYTCVILGSLAVFMISEIIAKNKILEFIGKNTLIIMCIHEPIKRVVIKLMSMATKIPEITLRTNFLWIILITIILMIILVPFILIINKYFPFFLGKTIRKKK